MRAAALASVSVSLAVPASGRAGGCAPGSAAARCAAFTPSEGRIAAPVRDSWERSFGLVRCQHPHRLQIGHAASRGGSVERRHCLLVRGRFEDEEDDRDRPTSDSTRSACRRCRRSVAALRPPCAPTARRAGRPARHRAVKRAVVIRMAISFSRQLTRRSLFRDFGAGVNSRIGWFTVAAAARDFYSCWALNVSQLASSPDFRPATNQRVRCAEDPCVKASGTT